MSEQTEITYVNVQVQGARGEVVNPETGESVPAYFFIFDDPSTGKRHVVPMQEKNKAHVEQGWTGVEIAQSLPTMAVPGAS